jgi:hypothetical protein
MMTLNDRQPIIVADAGPLIRLAAAGLLDSMRVMNRRIVLIDRVEEEVVGDLTKPFANEIKQWFDSMGEAIVRERTVIGRGIEAFRRDAQTPDVQKLLKQSLRNSGELALREFIDRWQPTETSSAIVLFEDQKVAHLFNYIDYPVTLMTTRKFAQVIASWGVNIDAVAALEAISKDFHMYPPMISEIDPDVPGDLRRLPQSDDLK